METPDIAVEVGILWDHGYKNPAARRSSGYSIVDSGFSYRSALFIK